MIQDVLPRKDAAVVRQRCCASCREGKSACHFGELSQELIKVLASPLGCDNLDSAEARDIEIADGIPEVEEPETVSERLADTRECFVDRLQLARCAL